MRRACGDSTFIFMHLPRPQKRGAHSNSQARSPCDANQKTFRVRTARYSDTATNKYSEGNRLWSMSSSFTAFVWHMQLHDLRNALLMRLGLQSLRIDRNVFDRSGEQAKLQKPGDLE